MIALTSRQLRTVERLLASENATSIAELATELRLSPRMVRSDLDRVERFLVDYDVLLERRRGIGVWLAGEPDDLKRAREAIRAVEDSFAIRVFSPDDRLYLALFAMLSAAPEPLTVEDLRRTLEVSVTSARRDVARAEEWLASRDLFLARRPGVGVSVIGTETAIRRSFVKLLLETIPPVVLMASELTPDWWRIAGISAGIREYLQELPLAECRKVIASNDSLNRHRDAGHRWLAVDLAVTLLRIRTGRDLVLEPGTLRSLRDHPVWETVDSLAGSLSELTGVPLTADEIGGITEHLLGAAELTSTGAEPRERDDPLVDAAVAYAAEQLHPGLADDSELISGLVDHVDRLRVRLKYGLPVHNPLLREVSTRYPDVHVVAQEIAELIGTHLGSQVSNDEAGFVTMYLSGALERLRLRPRGRAVVVCPTGIASAWILVSRIQAEFPELDLVQVLSAGSVDESEAPDADLIISTVELGDEIAGIPVVVVSPLLPSEDVRRVSRFV
jgi:mannitol operon transcriptional antiterminator